MHHCCQNDCCQHKSVYDPTGKYHKRLTKKGTLNYNDSSKEDDESDDEKEDSHSNDKSSSEEDAPIKFNKVEHYKSTEAINLKDIM